MDQKNLFNKDLAVKLCNSIELVYNSASEIKSVKEQDYEPLMDHFDIIGDFFKIKDRLGVLILCYLINRRLVKGKSYITLNELMSAFECSLVDSISINEQLEYFRKNKILVSTKKTIWEEIQSVSLNETCTDQACVYCKKIINKIINMCRTIFFRKYFCTS